MRSLIAVLLLAGASAFAPTWKALTATQAHPGSYLWTTPADPLSTEGLGGGITYAVDAQFCDKIIPQFREGSNLDKMFGFITCKLLRAALNRAFSTWSDNSPAISFYDITERCEAEYGGAEGCPLAEVYIATDDSDGDPSHSASGEGERAAYVSQLPEWGLLRTPAGSESYTFINQKADLKFSTKLCWYLDSTFCGAFHKHETNTGNYGVVLSTGKAMFAILWGSAILSIFYQVYRNIGHQLDVLGNTKKEKVKRRSMREQIKKSKEAALSQNEVMMSEKEKEALDVAAARVQAHHRGKVVRQKTGRIGLRKTMDDKLKEKQIVNDEMAKVEADKKVGEEHVANLDRQLKAQGTINLNQTTERQKEAFLDKLQEMSVPWTIVRLVLLIAPPTFYFQLLLPCFECFDFESAATHEIGHLLGLAHPNQYPDAVMIPNATMDNVTCLNPEGYLNPPDAATIEAMEKPSYSMMTAFTQNPSEVCLTADDLDGLNYLYPVCENAAVPPSACYKSERNIGWLRFAVWVITPLLLTMVSLLCVVNVIKQRQARKMGGFAQKLVRMEKRNQKLLDKMKVQADKASAESSEQRDQMMQMQEEMKLCEAHMAVLATGIGSNMPRRKTPLAFRAAAQAPRASVSAPALISPSVKNKMKLAMKLGSKRPSCSTCSSTASTKSSA